MDTRLEGRVGVENARSTITLASGTECGIGFEDSVLSDRNPGESGDVRVYEFCKFNWK